MGNKFVMVGGGSTQSPGILEVLRKRAKELNLSDLVLYDIDEERVSLLGQYTKMFKQWCCWSRNLWFRWILLCYEGNPSCFRNS